ncbi:MAG: 50S ribosomal protein L22 [Patescibacteria group bacterium]|jgi:large subunit ribosomal protein L22
MEIKAKAKHIKISPRKVRLVVDAVRGLNATKALEHLKFINKKASGPVGKLLKSGIANAVNNYELEQDNLYIKEIRVDEGAVLKRWQPKAHGRATTLRKKMSHIILTLAEIKSSGKTKSKKHKIEAPVKLGAKPKEDEGVEIKKENKEKKSKDITREKGKEIIDPREEGSGKHVKIEGGSAKGFSKKIFRRKSG